MNTNLSRRELLKLASLGTAATTLGMLSGCEQRETNTPATGSSAAAKSINPNEEYVWLSANANLPLFTAHDHPALELAGKELGVKVSIAGPNSVDIPGLVAAVEQ